jgi:hypothetical protein
MMRPRTTILVGILLFTLLLMGHNPATAKQRLRGTHNHVAPGQRARALMNNHPPSKRSEEAIKQIVRLLHDSNNFVHVNREHLRMFAKPNFSLAQFKKKLSNRIAELKAQTGGGKKRNKEINKLTRDLEGADRAYAAYVQGYANHHKRDWPFCLAGEEYVALKVIDGCTSHAKTFITLANASNLFDDVRLLVSKRYEGLKEQKHLLGTGKVPTKTINGHQMVLVRYDDTWHLVNTTFYKSGQQRGVEQFEILDKLDGARIDPNALLYKEINLPSMRGQTLQRLVVGAVGSDRHDDLNVHRWEDAARIGTSIPLEEFKKL